MGNRGRKEIIILFLLLLFQSGMIVSFQEVSESCYTPKSIPRNASLATLGDFVNYTPSDPIIISNDDDFFNNNFEGNGTEMSPYTIEYLNITVEFDSDVAIRITNTRKHFIISNCFVSTDAYSYPGLIVIENASNWKIQQTIVVGIGMGIYSDSCRDVSVVDSCFIGLWSGIWFLDSKEVLIWNNEFTNSQAHSIIIESITECEILNNTFSKDSMGVLAAYVVQTTITGNLFVGGVHGIEFYQVREGLIIKANDFVNLSSNGISSTSVFSSSTSVFSYSTTNSGIEALPINTVIEYNTFVNCSTGFLSEFDGSNLFSNNTIINCRVGINLGDTGNRIVGNYIHDSTEYGVFLENAHQNRIYGNIIINSGTLNGFDEDGENFWDDGEGEGNSWSDYNGTNIYSIMGSSNSSDRWPSRSGAPYISIINETEIVVGISGVNITWYAFDSDPLSYSIIMNGTILRTETWDGTDIIFTLQGLEPGVYNFTTIVMDVLGLSSSASTFVTYIQEDVTLYIAVIGGIMGVVILSLTLFRRNTRKGFQRS